MKTGVKKLVSLLLDRFNDGWGTVPSGNDTNASTEVDPFASVRINERGTAGTYCTGGGKDAYAIGHDFFASLDQVVCCPTDWGLYLHS
jgi:hypothetical protein